jgi:hypothetical protein
MKAKNFDLDAKFSSLVGGFDGFKDDMSTGLPRVSYDIAGPHQPAMTPTEVKEASSEIVTKGLHCSPNGDADPDWNTKSNFD